MEDNWVVIFRTPDEVRATIARQTLLEAGIEAVVINKKDSTLPHGEAELYVSREREEEARLAIKEFIG
jgi:hydroxypyruvate isomerase